MVELHIQTVFLPGLFEKTSMDRGSGVESLSFILVWRFCAAMIPWCTGILFQYPVAEQEAS